MLLFIFLAFFINILDDRLEGTQDDIVINDSNYCSEFYDIDPGIWVDNQTGSTP